MMFASKTPRENNDPEPYVDAAPDFRRMACPDEASIHGAVFDPRPEFDHVQHINPNPILIRFRKWIEGEDVADPYWVAYWITAFDEFDAFGGFKTWDESAHALHVITTATDDERNHARRVLERLARFPKEVSA